MRGSLIQFMIVFAMGVTATCGGCAARGPSMAQWIDAKGGIEDRNPVAERAQRVADRLAAGRQELHVRVSVLATDAVSAFSWPDRQVFVTRGLLERLNDDELAAAMAHELGHLLN